MDAKALETIKLLGNQVLAIREIMDQQEETIMALRREIAALKQESAEARGDTKMLQIDQRDLAKQIKSLRQSAPENSWAEQNVPSQDEISRRFYPNYDDSSFFLKNGDPRIENRPAQFERVDRKAVLNHQALKPNAREHVIPKDFVFARVPRLLHLD